MEVGVAAPLSAPAAPDTPALPVHIEAIAVSKRFGGASGVLALDDVSLCVRQREFVSILGPSGCGKSTLLRCVAGLERCSAGTIRVEGQIVRDPPAKLGMVFQRDVLLEWRSILDNLFLPIDLRRQSRKPYVARAHELLALFGLDGFERAYPAQLSGGMRQRAAICRA
ncbi:MAG: ABC transporter ATP-binding protein, partial [Acetobacteraceae bacterium]